MATQAVSPTTGEAETRDSWVPMIVIAMGQMLMSFNVAAIPVSMGGMVERSLSRSVEALKNRDLSLAHHVMAEDAKINQKRFDIEKQLIESIAKRMAAADKPSSARV